MPSEPDIAGNGAGWGASSSAVLPTTRTQRGPEPTGLAVDRIEHVDRLRIIGIRRCRGDKVEDDVRICAAASHHIVLRHDSPGANSKPSATTWTVSSQSPTLVGGRSVPVRRLAHGYRRQAHGQLERARRNQRVVAFDSGVRGATRRIHGLLSMTWHLRGLDAPAPARAGENGR